MSAAAAMCHIHRHTTHPTQRFKPQAILPSQSGRIEMLPEQIASADRKHRFHATSHVAWRK